jgi:hypothetical protein
MPGARSAGTIFPRLEGETHHQPDHDDHGHQTEEDDALPYLGAKIIVRLFADDSHVRGVPSFGSLYSCRAKEGRATSDTPTGRSDRKSSTAAASCQPSEHVPRFDGRPGTTEPPSEGSGAA